MNTNEFRAELTKIMPGYKWTVARPERVYGEPLTSPGFQYMEARGIQSAGFNRMSTLEVTRNESVEPDVIYEVKLFGSGMRGPSRASGNAATLARALRYAQMHCEAMAGEYTACVRAMNAGRANVLRESAGEYAACVSAVNNGRAKVVCGSAGTGGCV